MHPCLAVFAQIRGEPILVRWLNEAKNEFPALVCKLSFKVQANMPHVLDGRSFWHLLPIHPFHNQGDSF